MFEKELTGLEYISKHTGNSPDLVQGGGGNTSAKLNDELMAIKASGFKINQVTSREGYVVVRYNKLLDYYNSVDLKLDKDYEKEIGEFVKANTVELEGVKKLRPSVEVGFHSFLKKYVIHSHSVYANIVCCSKEGKELADKIFKPNDFDYIWIPEVNPGFYSTMSIKNKITEYKKTTGRFPSVILMENHGLIVSANKAECAVELHNKANLYIKDHLNIKEQYPEIVLEEIGDNKFRSETLFVQEFIKANKIDKDFFEQYALYPDQLVYLNDSISFGDKNAKLYIDSKNNELIYSTGFNEALTIEETLTAYLYVINGICTNNLSVKPMNESSIKFIRNWEGESYRKKVSQG